MGSKVFVDSDVVLDFLWIDCHSLIQPVRYFELGDSGEIEIFLSTLSLNNIYYISRKYLGHKQAIEVIASLTEMTEIVGTTKSEIIQVLKNNFKDFEDSIQYSTALTINGIEAILTRNIKDYTTSQIAVFTPDDYLKMRS